MARYSWKFVRCRTALCIFCYFFFGISVLFWFVFCKTFSFSAINTSDQGYFFKDCNCMKHEGRSEGMLVPSSCSEESRWFGPHQKVISYSLFHGKSNHPFSSFVDGIQENIKSVRKFYPGWIMRIYSDISLNPEYCKVACMDLVFWCDVRKSIIPNLTIHRASGRSWRFMPLGDKSVDIFISRDLDSSIIRREKEIVTDWEYLSDKPFHTARDHAPWGRDRPVLAGMWGAKNYILGWDRAAKLREELLKMTSQRTQSKEKHWFCRKA